MDITTCRRCGEHLYADDSVTLRLGPQCRARVLAEALARWTPEQAVKAREAVDLGAVVPMARFGLYGVVGSTGRIYVAGAERFTCTCKAADCGLRCYHIAAALMAHLGAPARLARAA